MSILCRIGLHKWDQWRWSKFMALGSREQSQQRHCDRCHKLQVRYL